MKDMVFVLNKKTGQESRMPKSQYENYVMKWRDASNYVVTRTDDTPPARNAAPAAAPKPEQPDDDTPSAPKPPTKKKPRTQPATPDAKKTEAQKEEKLAVEPEQKLPTLIDPNAKDEQKA